MSSEPSQTPVTAPNSSRPVVLLIGFDPLFGRVIYNALNQSALLKAVQANARARNAARALAEHRPRAAIVSWEAVDAVGLRRLTLEHPNTGIVVVAESLTGPQARALVRCGAVVALERSVTRNLLIAATVLAGYGMRMEPRDDACERAPGVGVARALAGLTPREAEVLGLIECGEAPSSIAELLDVSPYTIRAQIRAIYRKLGVHNRAELREHRQQARDAVPADAPSSDGADVMRLDAMRRERRRPRPEWMRPPFSRSRTR